MGTGVVAAGDEEVAAQGDTRQRRRRPFLAADSRRVPPGLPLYRHYGLYAYRVGFLQLYPTLTPAPIERFEALEQLRALWHGHRIVVNVQGDEPLLAPALIERMASLLARHGDASIATACHAIDDPAEAFNPNVVKVVRDVHGYALYFSRATIPWARDAFAANPGAVPAGLPIYRHYGLYAYRVAFLARYPTLAPAPIERFEALEQLRALWHGHRIVVDVTEGTPAPGVDTPEDLERVRALYASGGA